MPGDLDGLGAAVTGGGSGIGLATAWLLGIVRATRAAVPHIRRSPAPAIAYPGQPAGPLHDRHRPDHRPRRAGAAPAGGPEVMSVPGALDILPLGGSGLQVSRLGLGTAPLGNLFTEVQESDADATIDAALGAGVTFVDTAPHYGLGVAERRLGRRLARVPRDRFVLSTKVGRLVRPLEAGEMADPEGFTATPRAKRVWDFSRDGVRRSLDESLDRLGLDRIDVALVHDPDNHEREAAEHALPALAELRDQGVVRAIGAGMNQAEMLTRFVRELDLDLVLMAGRYSLLDQGALTELLPACVERGVAVVIGGVFNSGLLADPRPGATFDYAPAPPELVERAGRLQAVCTRHGVPLRAVALAFPFGHPAVASVLVGARTAAEVQDAVVMLGRSVPAELWAELVADGLLPGHVPVPTS